MHDAGDERGIGAATDDDVTYVRRRSRAAARNDGHAHRVRHGPRQFQIVARPCAIAVDAGEQDLARAPRHALPRPLDRVEFRAHAGAGRVHAPGISLAPRIDARDDALRAEPVCALGHDLRTLHRRRIHADLVRAGAQRGRHVADRANAAADRERNEQALRRPAREIEHGPALLVRRADVEKHNLVGAVALVALGELDGIADVAQSLEPDALHDAALPHVEADDQATREAHLRLRCFARVETLPFVLNTLPVSVSACASEKPRALNAASTT